MHPQAARPEVNAGVRPYQVKGTIAFGQTSYGAQKCVGALVTVQTGLPGGTQVRLVDLAVQERQANVGTPQSLLFHAFDENPAASTFGDNATLSLHADDRDKALFVGTVAIASATGGLAQWLSALGNKTAVLDANGRLYFSVASSAASLAFSGAGTLAYRLGLQF